MPAYQRDAQRADARLGCSESRHSQALNQRGIALFQGGDRAGALAAFSAAAAADPVYAEPWNNAGLVLHGLGRFTDAVTHFERALALRKDYPEALSNRGRARQALDDWAGAEADFDQALALAPAGLLAVWILHNRGMLRHERGDPAGARADFDLALTLDPGHLPTYLARGGARKELDDLDGALADFNHVLEHGAAPTSAAAYHGRGGVRVLRNDFTGALADYEHALALEPANVLFHISRGNARYHLRDLDGLSDYRAALRLDAEAVCRELARLISADTQRNADDVLENSAKHLRLCGHDAAAYARRGLTLLMLGRAAEADTDLSSFCRLAPDMAVYVRRVLDLIRTSRGRPAPSARAADRAAALDARLIEQVFAVL